MGTLNVSASINDATSGVNQSANRTVTTAGEGTDQRVMSVGTSEAEITLAAAEASKILEQQPTNKKGA